MITKSDGFNPAAFFVRNWQFTLVLFGLLAALGINALLGTSRSEDPQFPIPIVYVTAITPGLTPTEVETTIAKPLADAIERIDNLSHDL